MVNSLDDRKIIELFFERSEQAIIELSKKYGSVCSKVAFNILNNTQDAEECVNDAYLGTWNTIPPQNPNPLLSYVCRIDDKTENDNVKHICYLNQIDGIANAAPLYLDPAKHYTEDWNNEKVTQYLGIDLSNLGSEFEYIGEQNHTVTYRNDGTLVRDLMGFSYKYSGSEFTVAVSKLSLPYDCIYALEESKKTNVGTEKGSVEVLFAGAAGGENATENQTLIVADFELNGVNYRVKAENISLTSFYNFVRSILNK